MTWVEIPDGDRRIVMLTYLDIDTDLSTANLLAMGGRHKVCH